MGTKGATAVVESLLGKPDTGVLCATEPAALVPCVDGVVGALGSHWSPLWAAADPRTSWSQTCTQNELEME